ncbi:hypothetical protein [Rhizobium leguminosarum]|uniref:hypothetical protein n=1 Tax=Rhizobium leguminosarum TaxID=384 RepID=UPI00351589C9
MSDIYKTFRRRFDRVALGLLICEKYHTFGGFAKDVDIYECRVRQWLFNGCKPRVQTLIRICEVLSCPLDAIAPPLKPRPPAKPKPVYLKPKQSRVKSHNNRASYFQKGRA